MTTKVRTTMMAAGAGLGVLGLAGCHLQVTTTFLPPHDPGAPNAYAAPFDVDNQGRAVGLSWAGSGYRPVLWEGDEVTDLMPGVAADGSASEVNDAGQVLIESGLTAYMWDDGQLTDLGGGAAQTDALDLNEAGQALIQRSPAGSSGVCWPRGSLSCVPGLWEDGTFTEIRFPPGDHRARADRLSEAGHVVGEFGDSFGVVRPFVWHRGTFTELPGPGFANAVNSAGQVVGSSSAHGGAVLWQGGRAIPLGGSQSSATDINDRGEVVGYSTTASGQRHAVLWSGGQMRDLGTLGGDRSEATAINEQGQVVGTSRVSDGQVHAFLWDGGEMLDLGPVVEAPRALNDQGQAVGDLVVEGNSTGVLWEVVPR